MPTFTDEEMDAAEAAFKRAEDAHDSEAMRHIAQSPAFSHCISREAQKQLKEAPLLGREGDDADRLRRLSLLVAVNHSIHKTSERMMAASIRALVARVDELEKTPFAYDGPYEGGKTYGKGTFVSHGGSLWHCNYKTASRPGDGPAWTLSVKRGQDGKDLRS